MKPNLKGHRTITVKKSHEHRYKKGYPLLQTSFVTLPRKYREGELFHLVSKTGEFIGKGYIGSQNRGMGWILSHKEAESIDGTFFMKKIATALNKRSPFFSLEGTTAFRIFNGEGDGVGGLTIDLLNDYLLIQWYSKGIYCYKDFVIDSLNPLIQPKGIYEKKRFDRDGGYIADEDFVLGTPGQFPMTVQENHVHIEVDLNDGPMIGYFLDQRDVRKTLMDSYYKGKEVLNTFSYTGVFSVFAALGGAKTTTSVDLAKRSKSMTENQFLANGLSPDHHRIIVDDVFHFLREENNQNSSYDVVILDPPSFSRSKDGTFSAKKDYVKLLQEALKVTRDQGLIIASTNCGTFSMKTFEGFIKKAFQKEGLQDHILHRFSLPKDFPVHKEYPEGNYLKVIFVETRK